MARKTKNVWVPGWQTTSEGTALWRLDLGLDTCLILTRTGSGKYRRWSVDLYSNSQQTLLTRKTWKAAFRTENAQDHAWVWALHALLKIEVDTKAALKILKGPRPWP